MACNDRFQLSPKKLKAVQLLVSGLSLREAAAQLGISDRTLRRWCKRPEFKVALQEAQREAWGHMVRRLRALGDQAVTTLKQVMQDANATPSSRVAAARCVIEAAARLTELTDEGTTSFYIEGELHRRLGDEEFLRLLDAFARSRRKVSRDFSSRPGSADG